MKNQGSKKPLLLPFFSKVHLIYQDFKRQKLEMQFANVSLDFIVFANIIDDLALALNSQREQKKDIMEKIGESF